MFFIRQISNFHSFNNDFHYFNKILFNKATITHNEIIAFTASKTITVVVATIETDLCIDI